MKIFNNTFLLRLAVAIILFMHSVPGMFNNGVNTFGTLYLDQIGFAPFGIFLAWTIKLSHLVAALCLLFGKYVKLTSLVTILVLITGIILIHFKEGWYVVGGGRNGVEFNFLLIFALLAIMFPNGLKKAA
ncbi:DoxX family protein [Flavobacterium rhamnosiphilum]|uniref:DoxX family protein n=1 Tax=Flavobacterium rhamnosiphilum TaxID=2541724 RepID=A0A4V2Z953_9FLAO|nr:DoxX family protein [Flavobacterium rhamnosiphilum]TDE43196.1 DoxX family protein [Flavobacterium rhamnosiphilum]